jgi:protein-L-isoaspartate O-methyltransferase
MGDFVYTGTELELFAGATNWKAYWQSQIAPYTRGDVLEVGAGIGVNTEVLAETTDGRWVCLEPDRTLANRLRQSVQNSRHARRCEVVVGTLADLDPDELFDAILYIDVLEHVEDAPRELAQAYAHLKPLGALIVLAPAHQWLFTPFDEAVGHYRRYTKQTLASVGPAELHVERLIYLDAAGLLASAGNRLLLKSRMPTERQIRFWDAWLVPCSVRIDRWLGHSIGKSVLAIWRKPLVASSNGAGRK